MFEQKLCFWCGFACGENPTTRDIGGFRRPFHISMWKDCYNEYMRFKHSEAKAEMERTIKAAGMQ